MKASSNKHFYHNLSPFSDFKEITKDKNFRSVPDDWLVVITDIIDSTKAIKQGKYKDVNTIGAASIVSAHNAMKKLEFPYVFGGDGASFLIPPEFRFDMEKELKALKEIASRGFGLNLRIGIVGVSEVINDGANIELAKFKIVGKKSVAIIRGGGVSLAESKIKANLSKYEITGKIQHMVDLKNLSCRWNSIPAKRGKNLSMIVMARRTNQKQVFIQILEKLEELYEGELDQANPVNLKKMTYKSFSENIKNEKRLHSSVWSFAYFKRVTEIALSSVLFKIGLGYKNQKIKKYATSMNSHSDYRKFDDMLKMTIDCSPKQVDIITSYLTDLYQNKDIFFGIHVSDDSIMTCFVNGLGPGDHIHFIDGGDGGYAMASKHMKKQIKAG